MVHPRPATRGCSGVRWVAVILRETRVHTRQAGRPDRWRVAMGALGGALLTRVPAQNVLYTS